MIVLEFRRSDTFQRAVQAFDVLSVPFKSETSQVDFKPHRMWFFLEDVRLPRQQEALRLARRAEQEDRLWKNAWHTNNLAEPS
jgi:hypothetical protein